MKDETTVVVFRKDAGGITAVFPEEPADQYGYEMTCYAHIGQHSACTKSWYFGTKAARPAEYADLQKELESIGYRLRVVQRITRAMDDNRFINAPCNNRIALDNN